MRAFSPSVALHPHLQTSAAKRKLHKSVVAEGGRSEGGRGEGGLFDCVVAGRSALLVSAYVLTLRPLLCVGEEIVRFYFILFYIIIIYTHKYCCHSVTAIDHAPTIMGRAQFLYIYFIMQNAEVVIRQ